MFNVKAVEKEAKDELAKEQSAAAKARIKGKLAQIANAEKVLANLKAEYDEIIMDIGKA